MFAVGRPPTLQRGLQPVGQPGCTAVTAAIVKQPLAAALSCRTAACALRRALWQSPGPRHWAFLLTVPIASCPPAPRHPHGAAESPWARSSSLLLACPSTCSSSCRCVHDSSPGLLHARARVRARMCMLVRAICAGDARCARMGYTRTGRRGSASRRALPGGCSGARCGVWSCVRVCVSARGGEEGGSRGGGGGAAAGTCSIECH